MSPKKCPRKVTQKEDISWTFLSTRCRQKCPRNVTSFVHEMSPIMSTKCLPPVNCGDFQTSWDFFGLTSLGKVVIRSRWMHFINFQKLRSTAFYQSDVLKSWVEVVFLFTRWRYSARLQKPAKWRQKIKKSSHIKSNLEVVSSSIMIQTIHHSKAW